MVIKPPAKRSAIAFLAAALISACGGGASNSGPQNDDSSGTVQSPAKVGTSPTSPTGADGNAPAYGPTTDVTPIPAPQDPTTPPVTTPPATTPTPGACPAE